MTSPAARPTTGPTTTFTVRSPEDLLAIVPVVLGFHPDDSVAMLTFGAERTFHARVDLPRDDDEIPDVVSALLEPALVHRVRRVVFVVYASGARESRVLAWALARCFEREGIEVLEVLRADGRRWFTMLGRREGAPDRGVPYDVLSHPFAAQAVLDGRVVHGSRAELDASLDGVAESVASVAAAVAELPEAAVPRGQQVTAWVERLLKEHVAAGTVPRDADLARLLVALREEEVQAAASGLVSRQDAPAHVSFWTEVVRRTPATLLATPAAVLGLAAWLAGHGALAWCALDRCRESDPDHRLARAVGDALVRAVPPSAWDRGRAIDDPA